MPVDTRCSAASDCVAPRVCECQTRELCYYTDMHNDAMQCCLCGIMRQPLHTSEESRGVDVALVGAHGSLAGRLDAAGGSDRPTPGGRHGAGCRSVAEPGDCRRLRADRGRVVPRDS